MFARNTLISRSAVLWRYLDGSKVKHALPIDRSLLLSHVSRTLCGHEPWDPCEWRGVFFTEWETAEALRECRNCAAQVEKE